MGRLGRVLRSTRYRDASSRVAAASRKSVKPEAKVYPRPAGIIAVRAPVAQWIERRPPEPKVAGSNPVGRATSNLFGQRQRQSVRLGRRGQPDTHDLGARDGDPLVDGV